MEALFPEIKVTAVRESVAELIRAALVEGRLKPGQAVSEPVLAAHLKISRGPIREALLMLAQEGLVSHSQNRGFTVLQLTDDDTRDIAVVRVPLEAVALKTARERSTPDDLGQLSRLKDNLLEASRAGDFGRLAKCDLEFHTALWEKTRNPWLDAALKRVVAPTFVYAMVSLRSSEGVTHEVLTRQHELYLEFLRGECKENAEECVRFHLNL